VTFLNETPQKLNKKGEMMIEDEGVCQISDPIQFDDPAIKIKHFI